MRSVSSVSSTSRVVESPTRYCSWVPSRATVAARTCSSPERVLDSAACMVFHACATAWTVVRRDCSIRIRSLVSCSSAARICELTVPPVTRGWVTTPPTVTERLKKPSGSMNPPSPNEPCSETVGFRWARAWATR